jgi:hypothetical protein
MVADFRDTEASAQYPFWPYSIPVERWPNTFSCAEANLGERHDWWGEGVSLETRKRFKEVRAALDLHIGPDLL